MLRIIFTITIQQVFSTCSENIMSFVYIFFIQQMIFCMSEPRLKTLVRSGQDLGEIMARSLIKSWQDLW